MQLIRRTAKEAGDTAVEADETTLTPNLNLTFEDIRVHFVTQVERKNLRNIFRVTTKKNIRSFVFTSPKLV